MPSCLCYQEISCDSCHTKPHASYGQGNCVSQSVCPSAVYVSGLCESFAADVKCCYTYTGKLPHSSAVKKVNDNGMSVVSSGGMKIINLRNVNKL
jgi:hypothetical protein